MRRRVGIEIARAIIAGDVWLARRMLGMGPRSYTVAECRAIIGACREAYRRYGCQLSLSEFLL